MSETNGQVTIEIVNPQGLHARPVMKFVDLATTFQSDIKVDKGAGTEQVDGKSPMHMMLLAAPKGTALRIMADGVDSDAALKSLAELVNNGFDEM
ncbi:MAG: phosphocarrier protein HPr [Phycisphaerae bacterium]|nr:MAG: phosphocarrier protein HPr [Phycisphaerae bacterium]